MELRAENPTVTAAEMARVIGVKRQAVSALLRKMGLPTAFRKEPNRCKDCKNICTGKLCRRCYIKAGWVSKRCKTCSKSVKIRKSQFTYREKSEKYSGDYYCNRECFYRRNDWKKEMMNEYSI